MERHQHQQHRRHHWQHQQPLASELLSGGLVTVAGDISLRQRSTKHQQTSLFLSYSLPPSSAHFYRHAAHGQSRVEAVGTAPRAHSLVAALIPCRSRHQPPTKNAQHTIARPYSYHPFPVLTSFALPMGNQESTPSEPHHGRTRSCRHSPHAGLRHSSHAANQHGSQHQRRAIALRRRESVRISSSLPL